MTNNKNIIEIKDLSFRYDKELVLEHVSFHVEAGDFVAVVGPNGSGKSTLMKLILGLEKLQSGEIRLFDKQQSKFKEWNRIGYVSQKANAFNSGFPASAFEVVASGLSAKIGLFKFLKKEHRKLIMDALETVGMEKYIHQNIGELSGGQQQRIFIARALVASPEVLILDEPTVGVDEENSKAFYSLLSELNRKQGITLVLVTHEIGNLTHLVSHLVKLNTTLTYYGPIDHNFA